MKRLTAAQKKEALENALRHYQFAPKYSIYSVNKGKDAIFAIAEKIAHGGMNTLTRFMTYDEMNAYLFGYNDAQQKKYSRSKT